MRQIVAFTSSFAFLMLSGCVNGPSEDIGSATYAVCCGAGCCCPGIGSGGRINTGDLNPDNECEVCDPSVDPNSWQPVPGCTPGGSDAGEPPAEDAGAPDTDAGGATGGTDAGAPTGGTDAGAPTGGTDAGPGSDDGGGCSVNPTAPAGGTGLAVLGFAAALVFRRRRR